MDQPIRRKRHHCQLPAVRVPAPGSHRSTYEVRAARFVEDYKLPGLVMGHYERFHVAKRTELGDAMALAAAIGPANAEAAL